MTEYKFPDGILYDDDDTSEPRNLGVKTIKLGPPSCPAIKPFKGIVLAVETFGGRRLTDDELMLLTDPDFNKLKGGLFSPHRIAPRRH